MTSPDWKSLALEAMEALEPILRAGYRSATGVSLPAQHFRLNMVEWERAADLYRRIKESAGE